MRMKILSYTDLLKPSLSVLYTKFLQAKIQGNDKDQGAEHLNI